MSWLFSQALVAAFSGASSSDGEPSAPLSVMPTPHKFWRLDKTMEPSRLSRFGLMCAVLTEDRGEELLKSFLAAFPAPTFPVLGEEPESTGRPAAFGASSPGSLARFDLSSSSWKTPTCSMFEDLNGFSGTWPRWGSMRNGVCWGRITPALPTHGSALGFWPMPLAADGGKHSPAVRHKGGNHTLTSAVASCPTPRASDATKGGPNQKGSKGDLMLPSWVHRFPEKFLTPRATDTGKGEKSETFVARMGDRTMDCFQSLPSQIGGQLNPPWVEWLMGWPIAWTELEPLETARFQQWPHSHSEPSSAA